MKIVSLTPVRNVKNPDGARNLVQEAQRLTWSLNTCASLGLRLTAARGAILAALAKHQNPVNLEMISHDQKLRNLCDATTIYRTLMLLKDLRIVRQVNVQHKVRYFVLNVPGESFAYLICRCCGSISRLDPGEESAQMERQIGARGYTDLYHELEFHGVCPACQAADDKSPPAAKLPIRTSRTNGV